MKFWNKLFGQSNTTSKDSKSTIADKEKRYNDVLSKLEKFKRTAYIPQTIKSIPDHNSKSKMGGLPYLRSTVDWPVCPNCQNNMQLFLQLNLKTLPVNAEKGLIQLFYCTNYEPHCEVDLEAFFPFSKAVVCRRIDELTTSSEQPYKIEDLFEEKLIVGWTSQNDYPHFEEWEALGIEFDPYDDEVFDLMDEREEGITLVGDKLFGWPYWIQSVEYPSDRNTNSRMNLVYQIDSEINIPFMFGDAGTGHLTISADDENELAFGWACS